MAEKPRAADRSALPGSHVDSAQTPGNVPQPKIWTPSFTVLTAVNFVSALVFYLFIVSIVEYTMITYQASYSAAGLMVSAYVIASLCTRLFLGGKIDQWGLKRSIVFGTAVNMAAALLYFVEGGFAFLLFVRALHGVGFGLASGALAAAAALVVPPERRGEGIGYFSMAQALATGIGPFVAIALTDGGDYFVLFGFSAAVTVVALAGALLVRVPDAETSDAEGRESDADAEERVAAERSAAERAAGERSAGGRSAGERAAGGRSAEARAGFAAASDEAKASAPRRFSLGRFVQIGALPLALPMLLVLICYSGVVSFLSVFAGSRGLSEAASLYFVVYSAAILVSRPPVGRRVDMKGENSVIYFTFAFLAVGLVVLAFAYGSAVLLVSAALIGFGIGCTQSTVQTAIVRITPKRELGRANSTFFMSMDLGSGVGPVIIGAFIPLIGYQAVYVALAFVALAACLLYHVMHGRKNGACSDSREPRRDEACLDEAAENR